MYIYVSGVGFKVPSAAEILAKNAGDIFYWNMLYFAFTFSGFADQRREGCGISTQRSYTCNEERIGQIITRSHNEQSERHCQGLNCFVFVAWLYSFIRLLFLSLRPKFKTLV